MLVFYVLLRSETDDVSYLAHDAARANSEIEELGSGLDDREQQASSYRYGYGYGYGY